MAAFLSGNGFNESQVGTHGEAPITTAFDIALFYEKLYNDQLGDQEHTKEMFDLLKDLWGFLKERKKFWLLPIILVLLFIGFLIVMTGGSAIAPFIYTLF